MCKTMNSFRLRSKPLHPMTRVLYFLVIAPEKFVYRTHCACGPRIGQVYSNAGLRVFFVLFYFILFSRPCNYNDIVLLVSPKTFQETVFPLNYVLKLPASRYNNKCYHRGKRHYNPYPLTTISTFHARNEISRFHKKICNR